jgi:DNA repair exonuclease SbcCD ATPase subunit
MLASTVNADINNADVQNEIATSVYENRVARAELTVMDDPSVKQANDKAYAAQGTLLDKQAATQAAQEEYDSREAELDEKRESLRTAGDELQDNASDHTRVDMVNRAIAELQKTGEVVQEYKQHLEKAQAEEKKAQEERDESRQNDLEALRNRLNSPNETTSTPPSVSVPDGDESPSESEIQRYFSAFCVRGTAEQIVRLRESAAEIGLSVTPLRSMDTEYGRVYVEGTNG